MKVRTAIKYANLMARVYRREGEREGEQMLARSWGTWGSTLRRGLGSNNKSWILSRTWWQLPGLRGAFGKGKK